MPSSGDEIDLTQELIKYATGQFDIALVHSLNIPMLQIRSVAPNAFLECATRLTSLDVSRNLLTSLDPLALLTSLQLLDISCNMISSLEPLRKCVALEVLHAEGNCVDSMGALQCLEATYLPNLRGLHLQRRDGSDSNPVCIDRKSYVAHMSKVFGYVRCLDGHYFCKDELNPMYIDSGNDREIQLPTTTPWIPATFFGSVLMEPAKVGAIPEKAFYSQVTDCKKALQTASK
jgi:hypothetical protein